MSAADGRQWLATYLRGANMNFSQARPRRPFEEEGFASLAKNFTVVKL